MTVPAGTSAPHHATPTEPDARRRKAKRMLSQVIDALPTHVLEAVAADSTFSPRKPVSDGRTYGLPEDQVEPYLRYLRHERAARQARRLAAALMIDALLVGPGSGDATADAVELVEGILEEYDVNALRSPGRSPESRARQWWEGNRRRIAPRVLQRDGSVCRYCGATANLTIDHLTPLSRGGSNDMDNLGVACLPCNMQKKSKTEAEYDAWLADAAVTA